MTAQSVGTGKAKRRNSLSSARKRIIEFFSKFQRFPREILIPLIVVTIVAYSFLFVIGWIPSWTLYPALAVGTLAYTHLIVKGRIPRQTIFAIVTTIVAFTYVWVIGRVPSWTILPVLTSAASAYSYLFISKRVPSWTLTPILAVVTLVFAYVSITGIISGPEVEYVTDTLIFIMIWAIVSLSLNLEYGFTGLVNFGKAGFFLIGGYSVAIPMAYYRNYFAWTGNEIIGALIFGIAAGILISALVGAILSAIGARLREDYFGILTLVFAEILRQGIYDTQVSSIYGGPDGINGLAPIFPISIYTNPVLNSFLIVVLSAMVFVVAYMVSWRMINSPFGRSIRGIKDDELATQSIGKFTLWYKIQVMMIGSGITSVAGALYAVWILSTNPQFYLPAFTFQIFIISIMGGSSSLKGALLGSAIYFIIQKFADTAKGLSFTILNFHFGFNAIQAPDFQYIITGVLLILFVVIRPQGLVTEVTIKAGKVST